MAPCSLSPHSRATYFTSFGGIACALKLILPLATLFTIYLMRIVNRRCANFEEISIYSVTIMVTTCVRKQHFDSTTFGDTANIKLKGKILVTGLNKPLLSFCQVKIPFILSALHCKHLFQSSKILLRRAASCQDGLASSQV